MSALPQFLLNVDEEESDDLAAVGIDLNRPMSEPEIDAAASELLGRMAWYDQQIAQAAEAERLEVERIQARYTRRIDPLKNRRKFYEDQVIVLAQRADFGKKKSRSVGNGTFGKRLKPERIEITDDALALAYAERHGLTSAIKVRTSVVQSAIAPVVLANLHATGELPDGFQHHAETETYYAKAEV